MTDAENTVYYEKLERMQTLFSEIGDNFEQLNNLMKAFNEAYELIVDQQDIYDSSDQDFFENAEQNIRKKMREYLSLVDEIE